MITKTSGNGFALYSGVKLSNIDSVWTDKTSRPYAYLSRVKYGDGNEGFSGYYLVLSNSVAYKSKLNAVVMVPTFSSVAVYEISDNSNTFVLVSDDSSSQIFTPITYPTTILPPPDTWSCVWSNTDIYEEETENIVFSSSAPISLDGWEVIEWDGDTTGLESVADGAFHRVADYVNPTSGVCVYYAVNNPLTVTTELVHEDEGFWGCGQYVLGTDGTISEFGSSGIYFIGLSMDYYTTLFACPAADEPDDPAAITSVKVYPAEVTMRPGTDRTFEAVVTGTGTFDSSVDWTVHYGSEYGTPTITQDGQLTIPADMRPCTVIVLARSVEDPTKGGIAEVHVVRDTVYDDVSGPAGGNGSYGAGEGTGYTASGVPLGSNNFEHANNTMATMYALTGPKLNDFGNWLWSTSFDDAITKAQVEFLYGKVSDGVISLVSYPFGITKESTGECLIADESNFARVGNITFYKLESEFTANILQSSDAQIDWGTLNIDEYWGSFLDYSPYTTIELYLPWSTGFVPLNVNEVMGKPLTVKTNIELATGSCVHNIISGDECIASYSGQVGVAIPLTSSDLSNKLLKIGASAAVMAVGGAIAGAAVATGVSAAYSHGASYLQRTSGTSAFIPGKANRLINQDIRQANAYGEAIINEAANISIPIASAAARQATNVTRNGGFSADTASMTIQYPYLVISRPDISVPENYANFYGYPSNITSMLKDLTGYTEVANIHLENVDATADELVLIEKALKGGVIL